MQTKNWYLSELLNIRAPSDPNYIPFVIHANPVNPTDEEIQHFPVDFFSLTIVRHGRGLYIVDGAPYSLVRGDVYVMRPGANHIWSQCQNLFIDSCYFTTDLFEEEVLAALKKTPGFIPLFANEPSSGVTGGARWMHLGPQAYDLVKADLAEIQAEWLTRTAIGTLLTKYAFVRLLSHLSLLCHEYNRGSAAPTAETSNFKRSSAREVTVAAAVHFIEENFAEPISIDLVAQSVFLSPVRLREVFGSVMGRSPRDYLRHVRIEQAKVRLRTTDEPITQIGYAVGFSEASYFGRAFREATGMSPGEYRKKQHEGNARDVAAPPGEL